MLSFNENAEFSEKKLLNQNISPILDNCNSDEKIHKRLINTSQTFFKQGSLTR